MLSESSSFIATYCRDFSLAPIGGRADDRTTAPSPGGLEVGSRAAIAGAVAIVVVAVAAAALPETEWPRENNGSAASEAGIYWDGA